MMNPEIKAQWVTDLKSGEYTQGKDLLTLVQLDGTEKNCCLGVLCQQAVKAGVVSRVATKVHGEVFYGDGDPDDVSSAVLPHSVVEWAGLGSGNPTLIHDGGPAGASYYNDSNPSYSFDVIADLIDAQL